MSLNPARQARGRAAQSGGVTAERLACDALVRDGWTVLAQRLRTAAGEIDIAAERDGVLALVEVKSRATLAEAAAAVLPRQRARLLAAGEIILAEHPAWGRNGMRFDVIVVAPGGQIRRVRDAFRRESS
jgi:putative endonuclease